MGEVPFLHTLWKYRGRGGGLLLASLLGLYVWNRRPISHPPGILVEQDPEQAPPEDPRPWMRGDFRFVPLADFRIQARILSVERYRFDPAARLSPVDFALGWGPMSDSAVLDRLDIRQSGRWYHYRWRGEPPIPLDAIISHSANMHLIPATVYVERQLVKARRGQLVALRGKLVRVEGPHGFRWISSTTRTDSGDGSCEVVWVDDIRWIEVHRTTGRASTSGFGSPS